MRFLMKFIIYFGLNETLLKKKPDILHTMVRLLDRSAELYQYITIIIISNDNHHILLIREEQFI